MRQAWVRAGWRGGGKLGARSFERGLPCVGQSAMTGSGLDDGKAAHLAVPDQPKTATLVQTVWHDRMCSDGASGFDMSMTGCSNPPVDDLTCSAAPPASSPGGNANTGEAAPPAWYSKIPAALLTST